MRDMISVNKVSYRTKSLTQFAALCYRLKKDKSVEILLVTTRGSGRWIPPKGWPIDGLAPDETAAQEAFEEAGVKGKVHPVALGRYKYRNPAKPSGASRGEAYIFPLQVKKRLHDFKEKGERRVKWFSRKKAAKLVREPKLKKIIRAFDPETIPKR